MNPAELEYANQCMQQKWYVLVQAEQQGASLSVLEDMYDAYLAAVEDYNRCSATLDHQTQSTVPVKITHKQPHASARDGSQQSKKRKRKAS